MTVKTRSVRLAVHVIISRGCVLEKVSTYRVPHPLHLPDHRDRGRRWHLRHLHGRVNVNGVGYVAHAIF